MTSDVNRTGCPVERDIEQLLFNSEEGKNRLALELVIFKDNTLRNSLIKKAQEKYRNRRKS